MIDLNGDGGIKCKPKPASAAWVATSLLLFGSQPELPEPTCLRCGRQMEMPMDGKTNGCQGGKIVTPVTCGICF